MIHRLKTVEPYFSEVRAGNKTFEVRKADRDFNVGDTLELVQYFPETDSYGDVDVREITYILADPPYVPEGYVILAIKEIEEEYDWGDGTYSCGCCTCCGCTCDY